MKRLLLLLFLFNLSFCRSLEDYRNEVPRTEKEQKIYDYLYHEAYWTWCRVASKKERTIKFLKGWSYYFAQYADIRYLYMEVFWDIQKENFFWKSLKYPMYHHNIKGEFQNFYLLPYLRENYGTIS